MKKTQPRKIISSIIVFFVIVQWVFNGFPQIFNLLLDIQKVKATVIPSGVIIAWPSTAASIPSGWSRVTGLDTYYLEGTTADPSGTAGGNATHTHTSPTHTHTVAHTHAVPAFTTSATTATTATASGSARSTHTHGASTSDNPSITNNVAASASFGTASNDPPYLEVIWIQSNGTPTGIPNGADVWFNSDTLPGSWTRVAGNRFLKGAAASGDGGGTGGSSDAHTHTDAGHTHTEATHTHTGTATLSASTAATGSGTSGTVAVNQHTHPLTSTSVVATETSGVGVLANGDGQPPFYKLNTINNGTGGTILPNNIIAVWTGTIASIPVGWILCDGNGSCPNLNNYFIKGANADSEIGTTGGAATHTHGAGAAHSHTINNHQHTFSTGTQVTGNRTVASGTRTANTVAHAHTATTNVTSGGTTGTQTVTADANTDNRPPYKEAVFIMLVDAAPTLSVAQPDGTGDTVTVGDSYNVTYTLADADDVVTAAFAYDTNNSGLDGTAITGACATAAEGTSVTCSWNTTGVTTGSYYVYGITNDGVNAQVSAYSSGQITINAAGSLALTASSSQSFANPLTVLFTSQTSTMSNVGAIKVADDRGGSPGWSLAASGADWKSGQDVMQLDYDGTGSDGNLGKLCIKPNNGTLYAESGSLTNVSKGSLACFSASLTSINLITATGGNGTGTYWLTDMPAEQFFPSSPTVASYTTTIVLTLS